MNELSPMRILFLIRRFNDVDQFTPLIDALLDAEDFDPRAVCITSNFDYLKNENISYLMKKELKVQYLHNVLKLSLKTRIFSFVFIFFQKIL